jgi:hypothetical protein
MMLVPLALAGSVAAQAPVVRPLGQTIAISSEALASIAGLRELPNGAVLVNDMAKRRVVLLDAALKSSTTIADSTSNTGNAYGSRPGGLIPYRGDSTLFVDGASLSMFVIDGTGKIARTMAVPRSRDVGSLIGPAAATVGFDAGGRLVYRAGVAIRAGAPVVGDKGAMTAPGVPDSAMIVRVDLATRKMDTLAYFKIPKRSMTMTPLPNGGMSMKSELNPLPITDEWAILSSGIVVIVRGQDYHVDVVGTNGEMTHAAKIPFDWQRLTDEDKAAVIDSAKAAMQKAPVSGEGIITGTMIVTGGRGGGPGDIPPMTADFVSPSELPDYRPAFSQNALRPDADGNLWIRINPTKPTNGGPMYDVVNSRGVLIDRVQVPASRTIVGFGKGGTVYTAVREGSGLLLERAKLR